MPTCSLCYSFELADGESSLQLRMEQPNIPKCNSDSTEGSSGYGSDAPSTAGSESEDASSLATTPVGCGCGKCGLYTLCTKGCSESSVGYGTPFPILWNGIESTFPTTNSVQYSYESKLIDDTEKIIYHFASLVKHTVESFAKNSKVVPRNRIVVWIKQLEVIKPVAKASPLLGERVDDVSKAEDVEQLFFILSDYWSWYNNRLLEKLITEFGGRDDVERLRKYRDEFTAFLRQRLPPSQDHFNFGTEHKKGRKTVLIKVDEMWEAISLGEIRGLHHNIAQILRIPPQVLYLSSVSKGCICLNFMVPSFMPVHLFPLSASQEKALAAAKAFRLECGEYVWQVCKI